jgi:hypothetical protein
MIIQVATPIRITAGMKIKWAKSEVEVMAHDPFEISKDTFGWGPMSSSWSVKILTELIYRVGNL